MKKGKKKEKEKNVNKVIKGCPVGVLMLRCVELHDGSPPAKNVLSSESWYYLRVEFQRVLHSDLPSKKLKKNRERERKKERLSWV